MEDTRLDDTRLDELKFFYKSRVKKPELFNYDTEGDLIQLNKNEELVKKIELPTYRRPTYEEFNEMEQNRMKQIAFANKEFEDAKVKLSTLNEDPGSDVKLKIYALFKQVRYSNYQKKIITTSYYVCI